MTACSPLNPAKRIIGALQKDSKVLLEITEDFVPRIASLQLVSFFEMKMTNLGFYKTMVLSKSTFSNCWTDLCHRSLSKTRPFYTSLMRWSSARTPITVKLPALIRCMTATFVQYCQDWMCSGKILSINCTPWQVVNLQRKGWVLFVRLQELIPPAGS